MFPMFLIIMAGLFLLLIGIFFIYVQFYKRTINAVLIGTKKKTLPDPFNVAMMLLIAFLILAVFLSFVSGFGLAYRSLENREDGQIDITAFYAEIIRIDESTITINGIQLNPNEYRGELSFELHESVIIECYDQKLSLDELQEGDMITIILVTDKLGVEDIFKIQLLKD